MTECKGCKSEVNITGVGKCPVCSTAIEGKKKFLESNRRKYDHYAREDLLLGLLKMHEHAKEHLHTTDDHLEQDWLVLPMDKFLKTLKKIENAVIEISEELPLGKQRHKSLKILLDIYGKSRKNEEKIENLTEKLA